MTTTVQPQGVSFRRYRTLPNGKVLDAHEYGYKAWPFRSNDKRKPKR
jgi:hypothetical protein